MLRLPRVGIGLFGWKLNKFEGRKTQALCRTFSSSLDSNRFIDVDLYKDIEESQANASFERASQNDPPITLEEMKRNLSAQTIRNPIPINCDEIIQYLVEKNVYENESPLLIDIRDKSFMADYLIFCTVSSGKGLRNLALDLKKAFSGRPIKTIAESMESIDVAPKICGLEAQDWIALDFGNIIVHLMLPETRELYCLEKIWTGEEDEAVFQVADDSCSLFNELDQPSENVSL